MEWHKLRYALTHIVTLEKWCPSRHEDIITSATTVKTEELLLRTGHTTAVFGTVQYVVTRSSDGPITATSVKCGLQSGYNFAGPSLFLTHLYRLQDDVVIRSIQRI